MPDAWAGLWVWGSGAGVRGLACEGGTRGPGPVRAGAAITSRAEGWGRRGQGLLGPVGVGARGY
ncbi:hypothetical protein B6E66_04620 [Streptomyces maremycinicus]|nr:hypothetical protein B6E66_04620 [Streptomyces sp. B9173]